MLHAQVGLGHAAVADLSAPTSKCSVKAAANKSCTAGSHCCSKRTITIRLWRAHCVKRLSQQLGPFPDLHSEVGYGNILGVRTVADRQIDSVSHLRHCQRLHFALARLSHEGKRKQQRAVGVLVTLQGQCELLWWHLENLGQRVGKTFPNISVSQQCFDVVRNQSQVHGKRKDHRGCCSGCGGNRVESGRARDLLAGGQRSLQSAA
mmetsp:Transcript_105605/g.251734  ORF Transcript_105605/g.251734 Transcript_105605/m.251734 type:complete len:206 (+) Transcript_105605:575-1192(+)